MFAWGFGLSNTMVQTLAISNGCMRITAVEDIARWATLTIIVRLVGSMSPDQCLGSNISVLQQLQVGAFFDWDWLVRQGIVSQLTQVQQLLLKTFGYGSLLCSILYERVVMLHPVVIVLAGPPWEPRMHCWGRAMHQEGRGEVGRYWTDMVEHWFQWSPRLILDYPNHGVDFQGDLEMRLPPSVSWERLDIWLLFLHLYNYVFFQVFMI